MIWVLGIAVVCFTVFVLCCEYMEHREKMAEIDSRTCECKGIK